MDERRLATVTSAALALILLGLGAMYLFVLRPLGQTLNAGPGLLESLNEYGSSWWLLTRWLWLAVAAFGLGLIAALRRLAPLARRATADWVAAIGLVGFAALALEQVRLISHTREIAQAAAAGVDAPQRLVNLSLLNLIDRPGLLTFGAIAVWLLATVVFVLPEEVPTVVRLGGVLTAATVFLPFPIFVPIFGPELWLLVVTGIGALVVGPLFFASLSMTLRRVNGLGPPTGG